MRKIAIILLLREKHVISSLFFDYSAFKKKEKQA